MARTTKIYSVSQINSLIKEFIEDNLPPLLVVKGEITNFKLHSSGHYYFSLKDENSNLPCAMWKPNTRRIRFKTENGMAVLATGRIDVYVPYGRYQFIVDELVPAGVGALQLAFEQMVKKLRAEGLFEDKHKKALPAYPKRIGILTSEAGAAVHDIIDSIHNRWPCVKLLFYPVPVQGEGAARKIASALRFINRRNKEIKLDLLIVGRGGGSLEDLWAFNEEVLARAIFNSNIPVISAVGHEVDVTVADFVADARASTPTKAGVVAVPDIKDVLSDLANKERILNRDIKAKLDIAKHSMETILASWVFRNPPAIVFYAEETLEGLSNRMVEAMRTVLVRIKEILTNTQRQIAGIEPHRLLTNKTIELNNYRHRIDNGIYTTINNQKIGLTNWQNRVNASINEIMNKHNMQLTAQANRLAGLNPKSVLKRGYSITKIKMTGLLVKNSESVEIGDLLITELANENLIESKVIKK